MGDPAVSVSLSIYQLLVLAGGLIGAFWTIHMLIVNTKLKNLESKLTTTEDNLFSKLREVKDSINTINELITTIQTLYHDLDKQVAVKSVQTKRGNND